MVNRNMLSVALVFSSFLIGSIPSGVLLARAMGLGDPRSFGSGNIGASNLTRLGGKKLGALTFLCDFLKGLLPVLAALFFLPATPGLPAIAALFAVLGHCYSIFLSFSGGKGVATTAGALSVLCPPAVLLGLLCWLLVFFLEKISSLAAMVALLAVLVALGAMRTDIFTLCAASACFLVVIRRHEDNLISLLAAKERRFDA
jgi:glycerol-3-phosphate acyltransferase PlsY